MHSQMHVLLAPCTSGICTPRSRDHCYGRQEMADDKPFVISMDVLLPTPEGRMSVHPEELRSKARSPFQRSHVIASNDVTTDGVSTAIHSADTTALRSHPSVPDYPTAVHVTSAPYGWSRPMWIRVLFTYRWRQRSVSKGFGWNGLHSVSWSSLPQRWSYWCACV